MELPLSLTIEELKSLIAADTNHPVASQQLFLNGIPLNTQSQTLEEAGMQDGEMLALLIRRRGNPPQRQPQRQPQQPARSGGPDPELVRQNLLRDQTAADEVKARRPKLYAAINDPDRWREEYALFLRDEDNKSREREREIQRLNGDPFDIEAQRKIEEIIRQDRVIDNLQEALDHTPEGEQFLQISVTPCRSQLTCEYSIRSGAHALCQHRSERRPCQSLCRFGRPGYHHVPQLC